MRETANLKAIKILGIINGGEGTIECEVPEVLIGAFDTPEKLEAYLTSPTGATWPYAECVEAERPGSVIEWQKPELVYAA